MAHPARMEPGTALTRLGAALVLIGFVGTPLYFFGYLGSTPWGPPGTDQYVQYELANRLAAIPIALLLIGTTLLFLGRGLRVVAAPALIGAALMLAGNVGEFWIFSTESYTSVARNASWSSFLLGGLLSLVGLLVLGIAWLSRRGSPADTGATRDSQAARRS